MICDNTKEVVELKIYIKILCRLYDAMFRKDKTKDILGRSVKNIKKIYEENTNLQK